MEDYRAPGRVQRGLAFTVVGTRRTTATYTSRLCVFSAVLPKLSSASMQSESGIVPDFEVAEEEFQEEPKTYYELKSQPLKNRSVVWLWTVISRAGAVLVFR